MSSQTVSAPRDANHVPTLLATSSSNGSTPVAVYADPVTHRLLVSSGSGVTPGGLNTQLQYNNNGAFGGISGAVTDGTAVSLTAPHLLNPTINGAGAGLATLAYPNTAANATITLPATTGTVALTSQLTSGTVTTVSVTTANGVSGTVATATTTPAITLTLGAITPTTVNGNTFTTGTYTLTGAASKTLAFNESLTLAGTDSTTMTFPSTSATIARTDAAQTFTGKQTIQTIQTITAVAALALDGSTGNMFTKTIATGSTFTQSNFSTGQNFMVTVSGAFTITWFSGITWVTSGASAPTQAALTTYGFTCTGSNTFNGYLVGTQ